MAYLGASPLASFASPSKDTFSGDNSTTSFTMGQSAPDANSIEVFVDNVRQEPTSAYTVNGTTLTFTGTPATGSNNIYVIHKQGVIGNGLLPTSGRSSDRVGSLTVDGASTLTGNITAGGTLSGVTTLTTSSTATIGGDTHKPQNHTPCRSTPEHHRPPRDDDVHVWNQRRRGRRHRPWPSRRGRALQ